MFGVFYAIGKLFGFVKDAVVDDVTDYQNRQNRKINDIAYVGKNGLQSYETGHNLSFINNHTYLDVKTLKTIKVPLTDEDIKAEKDSKEKAIKNGYGVYRCCDYYLPDNVKGYVYKSVDNERLYVKRKIKNTLSNKEHRLDDFFYISIMPDNFGCVERDKKGNIISNDHILKDYIFDLKWTYWENKDYKWKVVV